MAAEGVHLEWSHAVGDIERTAEEILAQWKSVEDKVAGVPLGEVTYDNTVLELAKLNADIGHINENIDFYQYVSTDKAIRDASVAASKKISAFNVKSSMRIDVYQRVKALQQNAEAYNSLDAESKRYVDHTIRDYERKGLDKSEEERKEIEALLTEIKELEITFSQNLGEEKTTLEFTAEELEGMPQDFIDGLEKSKTDAKKLVVTLKYPHVFPISKSCKVSATRKAINIAFDSRCTPTNTEIMERLVELRSRLALKLGFPTHADYVLQVRMAANSAKVADFIEDLVRKLEPLAVKERAILLKYKEEECKARGEDFNGVINMWDFRYYMNKVEEQDFNVDHEAIKEYFPLDVVTKGLLQIYQTVLRLKFTEVENPQKWHDEVKLYAVRDEAAGSALLGYFYLDLHPREGKYGHAACFTLQQGSQDFSNGGRILPVAACVCNFPKPDPTKPKSSLLPHNQVVTFFHEFGHVMHVICAKAKYQRFGGTRVERDFVEAPSQMLENWCWETETLVQMSGHYQDTSKSLPEALAKVLAKSKLANTAMLSLRQLFFARFDQQIHTSKKADTNAVLAQLHDEILGIPKEPSTNFAASFGHLAGGYDAQYYGYMWSEVFAMDMFMTKFKGNLLNAEVGMQYRNKVLGPGGSKDATELLRDFLGREPNEQAFLKSKGLL